MAELMGGVPADKELAHLVREVAHDANMPPPSFVYEIPTEEPNAFAAGFSGSDMTVALTTGLRRALYTNELKAVIAHEMGHIAARDVRKNMHLAATVAGLGGLYQAGRIFLRSKQSEKKKDKEDNRVIVGLGLMCAGVVAKVGGEFLRAVSSRNAEYGADLMGARLYGEAAMVSALRKIDQLAKSRRGGSRDKLGARGSAFMHSYISNPGCAMHAFDHKSEEGSWWARALHAFDTHPTLEQRIESIRAYGNGSSSSM